jgi:hypothetical protein
MVLTEVEFSGVGEDVTTAPLLAIPNTPRSGQKVPASQTLMPWFTLLQPAILGQLQ